jgi:hypothetical protein
MSANGCWAIVVIDKHFSRVLDDTHGINPEVLNALFFGDRYGVLECSWKLRNWNFTGGILGLGNPWGCLEKAILFPDWH